MNRTTRRDFLKTSVTGGVALGLSSLGVATRRLSAAEPNAQVRVAVVGLGGIDTVGGVGGRGRQLIRRLQEVPGARVVALCDVDQAVLDQEVQPFKDRHEVVGAYTDIRKLLDDNWRTLSSAAVSICRPTASIWLLRQPSPDLG